MELVGVPRLGMHRALPLPLVVGLTVHQDMILQFTYSVILLHHKGLVC
jgi:hypothetical protein